MNIMSFDLTVRIYVSDASILAKTKHLWQIHGSNSVKTVTPLTLFLNLFTAAFSFTVS